MKIIQRPVLSEQAYSSLFFAPCHEYSYFPSQLFMTLFLFPKKGHVITICGIFLMALLHSLSCFPFFFCTSTSFACIVVQTPPIFLDVFFSSSFYFCVCFSTPLSLFFLLFSVSVLLYGNLLTLIYMTNWFQTKSTCIKITGLVLAGW